MSGSLDRVSLTGADCGTDIKPLLEMAEQYPHVEWAILLSLTNAGNQHRYPSLEWIGEFMVKAKEAKVKTAIHLCGARTVEAYYLHYNPIVDFIVSHFGRVQLNFNHGKRHIYVNELNKRISYNTHHNDVFVITQANEGNKEITPLIKQYESRHQVLFDASGGTGKIAESFQRPLPGLFCGYAGGIGPSNVETHLKAIESVVEGKRYWIDMESSLRDDNNLFSLNICDYILDVTRKYLHE